MNLDIRIFVNVVTMILDYFLQIIKVTKCNDQPHFDIELTKENNFYIIYVTNCNCDNGNFREILVQCFTELCKQINFESYFKEITTFKKLINGEESAYDLRYTNNFNSQICFRNINATESKRFAHLNVYQSFMFKTTLPSKDIEKFTEHLSRNITILIDQSSHNIKYTIRFDEKRIYQNRVLSKEDMINCTIMSSAINKIIERSQNEEFRTRCFSLLSVKSSLQTGDAIMKKLLSLVPKSHKENMSNYKLSTFQKNNQTIIINEKNWGKRKNNEVLLITDNSEANTSNDENKQPNIVVSPIIMSSRGRRIKKTKLYDEYLKINR